MGCGASSANVAPVPTTVTDTTTVTGQCTERDVLAAQIAQADREHAGPWHATA